MSRDRAGRTDLINAAIAGDNALVQRLLDSGADPNPVDNGGWSALHFAAQRCDAYLIGILLKAGANIDVRDSNGNTPLFRAVFAYRDGPDGITPLLEAGADPDAVNDHDVSPRSLALKIANHDAARFFRAD